ncbi:hypothetical protein BEWA_024580 [Theileria equi strain WA]|uniref:Signal peptide containing protein n=1 Tax=Theileria equi strain WA TaxID=1537102 RepID=L0AXH3_THEEQ|nr:hypothetical protein BEWA_024580 [Theileria equi strain WA]AFZ79609.1 hypothetical protein BEWA_024580 [Theileria equi strain WA]|eukprot:XP_004829275.1 hypothetical protein BEWA_024580 [Theileria equi strain WA]
MKIIALFLLVRTVLQSCASPANLDIGSANHPDFFLETGRECTLTRSIYRPKRSKAEVIISHRGGTLWSTGEKDECVNVQVFSRDTSPLFLHIVFARDNAFEDAYYVYGNKWEMCSENAFKEVLEMERIEALNIDSPNPLLGTLQRNGDFVKEETFASSDKCIIGKVEHNGKTLWEGERGDSLLSYTLISENDKAILLHLVYKRDDKQYGSYYHYSGDWITYTEGEYRDAFDKREKNILDINFPNSLLGNLTKYGDPAYGAIFISNDKFRITKLRDNGITIWEAKERECFIYSKQFLENGKVTLLQLVTTSGEDFYELSDGTWERITKKEFERDSDILKAKILYKEAYTSVIDISVLENTAYKAVEHKYLGVPAIWFISNTNTRLIYDSGHLIYKVCPDCKLNKVTVYRTKQSLLLDINYTEVDKENHAHFIKTNGLWETILGTDFDKILQRATNPIMPHRISLDIRIPDEKICKIENTGDPVCERVIIPKNEYRVTKVVDRNKLIWEAGEFEYILKATTYLDIGKPVLLSLKYANVEKYFGLSNGSWSTLRKRNFDKQAKKLKGRRIIDVNKKEGTFYTCSEYVHCGIPTVSFTPRGKVMVIKDGDQIIHRFEKEIENPTIRLYVAKEFKLLALSYIQHNRFKNNTYIHLYFEKAGDTWKQVNEERFEELLNSPQSSESELKKIQRSNISLDLSKVNPTYFTIEWDGSLLTITPKEGCNVTKITEKDDGIWEAVGNENTVIVWIRYKNKTPSLMHILVENSPGANKHFEKKQDGEWLPITEEDYKNAEQKLVEDSK